MNGRRPLPQRRQSERLKFRAGNVRYYATFSRFEDGGIAEVFLEGGKVGSHIEMAARDMAVAASLALQFGCPAETLKASLTRLDDGKAAGPLGEFLDLVLDHQQTDKGKAA